MKFDKDMIMRSLSRYFIAVLLLLSLAGMACADSQRKPFLWQIHSKTATVYLLGSMHAATLDMYPLPKPMYEAFDRAGFLVVELDINRLDMATQLDVFQKYGIYQDGSTLQQHVSADTWRRLTEYLDSRQLPLLMFQQMRPWLANITITMTELTRLGYDMQLGIDQHFLNRAHGKKPVLELETLDEQMAVLSGASDAQQETDLTLTLGALGDLSSVLKRMQEYWQRGDAEALYELMREDAAGYPSLQAQWEALLDKRNHRMADRLKNYLATDDTYFVVVGALHIGGENGLLDLLRRADFRVEQVK